MNQRASILRGRLKVINAQPGNMTEKNARPGAPAQERNEKAETREIEKLISAPRWPFVSYCFGRRLPGCCLGVIECRHSSWLRNASSFFPRVASRRSSVSALRFFCPFLARRWRREFHFLNRGTRGWLVWATGEGDLFCVGVFLDFWRPG